MDKTSSWIVTQDFILAERPMDCARKGQLKGPHKPLFLKKEAALAIARLLGP